MLDSNNKIYVVYPFHFSQLSTLRPLLPFLAFASLSFYSKKLYIIRIIYICPPLPTLIINPSDLTRLVFVLNVGLDLCHHAAQSCDFSRTLQQKKNKVDNSVGVLYYSHNCLSFNYSSKLL